MDPTPLTTGGIQDSADIPIVRLSDRHDAIVTSSSSRSRKDGNVTKKSKNHETTFPARLHYMLGELARDGLDHIIAWRPHGRAFLVIDQQAFANEVLPLWFRQSKYSSFQRQLNLYGFKRITTGKDKGCHYHENFVRGSPELALQIERTKIKGTGTRRSRALESQPNFYSMPCFSPSLPPATGVPHRVESSASIQTSSSSSSLSSSVDTLQQPEEVAARALPEHSGARADCTSSNTVSSITHIPPSCGNLLGLAHTATLTLELMQKREEAGKSHSKQRPPSFACRPAISMEQLSQVLHTSYLSSLDIMQNTTEQNLLLAMLAVDRP